jgi:acyl carrier protein
MKTTEQLTKIIRNVFDDDSIELTSTTTADDIEGWGSLSHINLIIAVEIEFGIEFKQNEIQNYANVGELMASIEEKLAAKTAS